MYIVFLNIVVGNNLGVEVIVSIRAVIGIKIIISTNSEAYIKAWFSSLIGRIAN